MRQVDIVKTGFWKVVDAILPPRCAVTGEIVGDSGAVSPAVWRDLRFIATPYCACCGVPFEFATGGADTLCVKCQISPPLYQSARAALVYDDASRDLILKFKYADQVHIVHTFTPWLKRAGAQMLAQADFIIPVPLHRFRLLRRRYNQAALIAQALCKETGLAYLPEALQRDRSTPSQGHLGYKERRKNVRGAFSVPALYKDRLAGKSVILADDVFTTGATVKECAQALLAAGVKEVHVLAVARVVRPEYYG